MTTWTCEWCGTKHLDPESYIACVKLHKPPYIDLTNDELRAELAKRDAEIAELKARLKSADAIDTSMCRTNDALKAEVKRLRGLLEEAMSYTSCPSWSPSLTQEIKVALERK